MKQASECLENYTVAKITMDCDFNPQLIQLEKVKETLIYTSNYDVQTSNYEVTSNYENCMNSNNELIYEIQYDNESNIIHQPD